MPRIHGGLRQVENYDELGYSDITFIAAPEACRRTSNISCIDLQTPLKVRLMPSGKVRDNKELLKNVFEFMSRSTLLLNFSPSSVINELQEWHEVISLPFKIDIKELIKYIL